MVHPVGRNQQKLEILKLDFVDNEVSSPLSLDRNIRVDFI